ncbi:MAG: TraR/DksA C4-type zinc finger protein [Phycisphaerales bacterium]|nr:TraR/DksA C4-type zinc finger protein [Phycisphaerales bacterium]
MPEKSTTNKSSAARRKPARPAKRAGKSGARPVKSAPAKPKAAKPVMMKSAPAKPGSVKLAVAKPGSVKLAVAKPGLAKAAVVRSAGADVSRNGKLAAVTGSKRAATPAAPISAESGKKTVKPAGGTTRQVEKPAQVATPVSPPREKSAGGAAMGKVDRSRAAAPGKAVAARRPVIAPEPVDLSGDSGLSRKDLEQFRGMLLEKRSQLVGDMSTMRDEALRSNSQSSGDLSSMPIHMADLGTDNFEQEFTLGLIEGGQQELREIDAALDRIEKRTYGLCLATGKPIGKARLKAQPWAKYCYEYMLEQERGKIRRY